MCGDRFARKGHDIDLPLNGTIGVEGRTPGLNDSHQLIFTFERNITVPGTASKTQGAAAVVVGAPTVGPNPNQVTVDLTGVSNAQHVVVTLTGVHDSAAAVIDNIPARLDVLLGDENGNGVVSNADVADVKAQVAAPVTDTNFRNDVNANGVISNGDVATTKAQVGSSLPPSGSRSAARANERK
jgi:hypothetical protein